MIFWGLIDIINCKSIKYTKNFKERIKIWLKNGVFSAALVFS